MIKILGLCYDDKSSFLKGPRFAPPLIREALHCGSMNLYAENGWDFESAGICDAGDFEISEYLEISEIITNQLQGQYKILTLGGDHSITYPIIRANQSIYGKIDILHIDAHADLYDTYEGDPFSHACPFARIMENGLANRLVQVGIRTLNPHQREQAKKFGVETHEMRNLDLSKIPKFQNPVYISLDLDAFDPAFAPGVSHQEPGGLTPRQVIALIQNLDTELIGADIVEYNPTQDVQKTTAFLAAKMVKEILAKF